MRTYKEAKELWRIAKIGYNWPLYSETQQKAALAMRKLCVLFYEIKKWEWEKSLEYIENKLQKRGVK